MGELQRRMSGREFAEWQAYLQVEPLPSEAAQAQLAQLIALLANAYRDRKQSKVYHMADFLPRIKQPTTWQQQRDQFRTIAQAINHGNH